MYLIPLRTGIYNFDSLSCNLAVEDMVRDLDLMLHALLYWQCF
jgi:hypothetical protein